MWVQAHFYLGGPASHTDEEIKSIHNSWSKEEVSEERILNKTAGSVEEREDVENHIPVMSDPESSVGVSPSILSGKHKDDDSDQRYHEACKSSHS